MENPQSESTVTTVEIKKDKLSENMESPTNTTNDENTPVLQDEANTPISHRPNQEVTVSENTASTPVINVEMVTTEEENTGNTKPDTSIYDNALHNPPVVENTATISPTENITSPSLPPTINTSNVPENINNPSLNSASSTGEVLASAWTSVSNYLWSWFEQPPEEGGNQANDANANTNNNNNDNNASTTNTQNESTEGGAGYYANLLTSFFSRPATDTSNTQTLEKRTSVSSLSSSRLNLLSQQARMPSIEFIGVEDHEEDVGAVKPIVDRELSEYIRPHLPIYQRESVKWILRYSTTQHGISLNTLYQKVEKAGPLLLAIRDTENNVCTFVLINMIIKYTWKIGGEKK